MPNPVCEIDYFSDVLCVWAYVGHRRLEELVEQFGEQVCINTLYCSVFPDCWSKIPARWGEHNGFDRFGDHVCEVGERFPHVPINKTLWKDCRPRSSAGAHMVIKAVELEQRDELGETYDAQPYFDRLAVKVDWAIRRAFFEHGRDISEWSTLGEIIKGYGLDIEALCEGGRAINATAALAKDLDLASKAGVTGSPTFIMNQGRQTLFGNVGYRLLEANVQELLRKGPEDQASWC